MLQDRIKTIFWLWMIKTVHPCLAGRRSSLSDSSFTRIGRVSLSIGKLPFQRQSQRGKIHSETYHGINLHNEVQPVMLRLRRAPEKVAVESEQEQTVEQQSGINQFKFQLTQPLISQEAWDASTGSEFQDEDFVEALTQSALELCTTKGNDFVDWYPHPTTERLLEEQQGDEHLLSAMQKGDVLVYVGKAKREGVAGGHLPLIKTQSVLPMSAHDMAALLMDSTKVKLYNKLSLGRTDVKVLNKNTKIVRNLIRPPIGASKMFTVSLVHSRKLHDNDPLPPNTTPYKNGYVVVSRAVPGKMGEDDDDFAEMTRNEILLGVNLLQDLGPNQCFMTAITHVYSPILPAMFAQSTGVSSAVNFVRDIRQTCQVKN